MRKRLPGTLFHEEMIKAVFFDLDGTITDTEKYYQATWPAAFAAFGYEISQDRVLELRSLTGCFARERVKEWFGEECSYDAVRAYRKPLTDELFEKNDIPLKPGAVELLSRLEEQKIPAVLVTAQNRERAEKNLEKAGLIRYFRRIIGAENVKYGKPAPDVYLYACREFGLEPENVLVVEDSPNGVKSAYGAGCRVVMVPDLSEPDEELMKMICARADSLSDIMDLLPAY